MIVYSLSLSLFLSHSPMGAAFSLSSMEQALKLSLRVPLPDGLERRLEYEFHSANYHILTDIVIGLRTALGHLIQVSNVIILVHILFIYCT